MVLECLTWIPCLWDKLICSLNISKDGFAVQDLPREILVDILSRLPGDCVLECRRVCKEWLALTSTPNFVEMHLKRATPVLFMQRVDNNATKLDMFLFDEGAKVNKMIKKMGAKLMHLEAPPYKPLLCGSCNGLLVFRPWFPSSLSFICNPLTREKITIQAPVNPGIVCGLFFHPCTKDYRLLFVHHRLLFHLMEGVPFEYFLYSLGGKFWKKLNDFPYRPNALTPPTILNGVLHWIVNPYWVYEDVIPPCSNSIMMFNMDTEEFRSMPHPGSECPIRKEHKRVCIFEMKGKLAFCHPYGSLVYVWVLEDYEKWIWVNRYSVNLYLDVERYPFVITHFSPSYRNTLITIVDIQNDELIFDWGSRGVFRYNMHQKTVKQINGVGMKKTPLLPFCDFSRFIIPYTKTFVSPSGFK
ncbi:hypothetical protein RHSIM_Rhsim11G0104000 [Rhododendron simsii]|uniref:F-box domain-containing protein n=1 Tax=Rhododendron simsii TaxID=118357 RepID=A0A834L8A8_RHOSS|nr:hypothetical protein RHSIM_Rhsim11G0104000 [Rhododendron simsii]